MRRDHSYPMYPSRALAVLATFFILTTVAVLLPPSVRGAETANPLFEQIGELERFGADARAALGSTLVPQPGEGQDDQRLVGGTTIVIPQARQLWQIYLTGGFAETGVVVRDLDTMRIMRTLRLQGVGRTALGDPIGNGGDWSHAVDDSGTRLWLVARDRSFVYEISLRTFTVVQRPLPAQLFAPVRLSSSAPFLIAGVTYDPVADDLLVLYGGVANALVANFNTFLYRMDVSASPGTSFGPSEASRIYRLRSCTGPLSPTEGGADTTGWDILVTKEHLYVPCQRAGYTVVVVRMPRPSDDVTTDVQLPEDVAPGPVFGSGVFVDRQSGRLFVNTINRQIWVFEASTMSFVGVVATGPDDTTNRTGFGLDPETGRVFFQSSTFGLGVVEGRFFPIPQARTVPNRATGQHRIWSDARTRRVFVLEGDHSTETAYAYRIYRLSPAPVPPPPPDPDRNTSDIAEKDGMTEARWNATASGYGTRVQLANGLASVVPAPGLGESNPVALLLKRDNRKCVFTDRDIFAGRVAKSEYDTGSTAAQAVSVDVDNATRQDLNQPSRCDIGNNSTNANGQRWTVSPATCSAGPGFREDSELGGEPVVGSAHASCSEPGGVLESDAESQLTRTVLPIAGLVDVDRSSTKTTIRRLEGGAVQATVESLASGINVGDALFVGEVRSRATSTSNGRPTRKDMSTHEIEIRHVRFGTTTLCEVKCRDLVALERDLNALGAGRVVFRTGGSPTSGRDEALLQGSPKGAQTAVQKSLARQTSDRALIGDFSVEVPGLEMTVFNDNNVWGRARELYQFAGVATSSTYNVVVRPTGGAFSVAPDIADEGPVADGGNTVFAGLLDSVVADPAVGFVPGPVSALGEEDAGTTSVSSVLRAIGRGLRLFLTDPRHALLLLTAWSLLGAPALLSRRRRLLQRAI